MMVLPGFRRSISLPKPNRPCPERSHHVRSTSLPCGSHPSISELQDQIQTLKAWDADPSHGSSAWLCSGLSQLKRLHDSLDDLFQLPQSEDSLRRRSSWVDGLLEATLRFADAYGSFRAALVGLKEEQLAAQVAVRHHDGSRISACVKSRKRIEEDIAKIANGIRSVTKSSCAPAAGDDVKLAGLAREAIAVTVSVSVAVFCWISSSRAPLKSWMALMGKRKKVDGHDIVSEFREASAENLRRWREDEKTALQRLKVLEEWIVEIEKASERLFRSLINARVSLLNVLTL